MCYNRQHNLQHNKCNQLKIEQTLLRYNYYILIRYMYNIQYLYFVHNKSTTFFTHYNTYYTKEKKRFVKNKLV